MLLVQQFEVLTRCRDSSGSRVSSSQLHDVALRVTPYQYPPEPQVLLTKNATLAIRNRLAFFVQIMATFLFILLIFGIDRVRETPCPGPPAQLAAQPPMTHP